MKKWIITISDDLDIFASPEQAENYHEAWILEPSHNFRAYDQDGNILTASAVSGKKVKLIPSGKKDIGLLKTEIANYLPRLIKSTVIDFKDKPLDELVSILVKNRGVTK